jgi:hypothetical protein
MSSIKETLEEAAVKYINDDLELYELLVDGRISYNIRMDLLNKLFIAGANWQSKRMYEDMQEYAEFCIECDRKQMPLLLVQDWYEHYKKEIV